MIPGVLDGRAGHGDRAGDLQDLVGAGQTVLDRRGRGDDLVHGPGFERRTDREVALFGVGRVVRDTDRRVEGAVVRHGEHFAGVRVEHHSGGVLRPGQVLRALDLLLHVVLQVVVDRELDGGTVDGG